jgi:hypothetical protein
MCECEPKRVKQEVYRGAILFRCAECGVYQQGGEYNE